MNRTCVSSISDYGYYDPGYFQRSDTMGGRSSWYDSQNLSDLVKMSIMGDQGNFDYSPDSLGNTRGQADVQSQLLVYKTQQIAQSHSFDECTCSSYSSDVPHCTCDKSNSLKSSLELDPTIANKAIQEKWISDAEYNRIQLLQSLAVPDPSHDYPFYPNYDSSIYEAEVPQTTSLQNTIVGKAPTFTGFQRVPSDPSLNVPSPITSPVLKTKTSRPRLCHFLFELLANPAQYSDIIEWVDREKGVFKFLNSAEVASQWGRRRNKPHMKYENFARSLRTYIAKGILTKPRSKLVYRFTSKVY